MRFGLAFGLLVMLIAPAGPANADTFSERFLTARRAVNPIGDRALRGESEAIVELEDLVLFCLPFGTCSQGSEEEAKAASAAANLGWLIWTKNLSGEDGRWEGMAAYAAASRLGAPSGYFQVAKCLEDRCLSADDESEALGVAFEDFWSKPWDKPGDPEHRRSAIRDFYQRALNAGLTDAAIALGDSYFDVVIADGPAAASANRGLYDKAISVWKSGLETDPSEDQRSRITQRIVDATARLEAMTAPSAQRRVDTAPAPTSSSNAGPRYAADKSKAQSCVARSVELKSWRGDLNGWRRDLDGWSRELQENANYLSLGGARDQYGVADQYAAARQAAHDQEVREYRAEQRDFEAERRSFNSANDAHNSNCSGSFDGQAIKEVCQGSAASSDFCRSFD